MRHILLASLLIFYSAAMAIAAPVNQLNPQLKIMLQSMFPEITPPLRSAGKGSVLSMQARQAACVNDLLDMESVKKAVVRPLRNALLELDASLLQTIGLVFPMKGLGAAGEPSRVSDGIAEYDWKGEQTLADYIRGFRRVEYVDVRVLEFYANPLQRDAANAMQDLTMNLQLDVRGEDKKLKNRRQDQFYLALNVHRSKDRWLVTGGSLRNGLSIVSRRSPYFTETTRMAGLGGVPTYLRTEAIRRGGYALSVTDINNDGHKDLFIGLRDEAIAYQGDGSGKFTKVSTGLEGEKYIKTAVFADFDNDGDADVILNRFLEAPQNANGSDLAVVHYVNDGHGKFTLAKQQIRGDAHNREPMPSAVADFSGDGFLDLYVGYPGVQDFSAFYDLSDKDKAVQGLYVNNQKGGFIDFTSKIISGADATKYQLQLFPHSSLAIDFDQDHDMDLFVIDDRGNLSPVYENMGDGTMKQNAKEIGIENFAYGMSISSGDLNNDGITDLAVTNVLFSDRESYRRSCSLNWKGYNTPGIEKGFAVYRGSKTESFAEVSDTLGMDNPGEATGGLTFLDYNNDGFQDIYVVNGLWSGTESGQELSSLFTALLQFKSKHYALRPGDKFHFMELLSSLEGRFDNIKDLDKITYNGSRPSLGGFQRNRLFRNNGDGSFTDVAYIEGVDSIADGYIVGKADLDEDGRLDLVLRNADPGTAENKYAPLQLFRNHAPKRNFLRATFTGRKSNRDAIGLFAIATYGGKKQIQHLEGNSGALQQERALHFGLGSISKVDRLEVHWPSGQVETFENLKPGNHHFEEPALEKGTIAKRMAKLSN